MCTVDHNDMCQIFKDRLSVLKESRAVWSVSEPKVSSFGDVITCIQITMRGVCLHYAPSIIPWLFQQWGSILASVNLNMQRGQKT